MKEVVMEDERRNGDEGRKEGRRESRGAKGRGIEEMEGKGQ